MDAKDALYFDHKVYEAVYYNEQKARLNTVEASAFNDLQLPITIRAVRWLPGKPVAFTQRLILV